jgi:hypothetical protein
MKKNFLRRKKKGEITVKRNFFCILVTSMLIFSSTYPHEKQAVAPLYIDCNFYGCGSTPPQTEPSNNNLVRAISKEVGEFLFAEMMATLPLIVAIDPKELVKASLLCANNCGYTLSCAEFGGALVACGPDAIHEVIEFKKLLNEKDPNKIRSFMLKMSNEKSIHCPLCKQCAWIEMVIDHVNP